MLGFWIIMAHILGVYLCSPAYVYLKTDTHWSFALIHSLLYVLPFVFFLPMTFSSLAAVFLMRLVICRFGLIDYALWARDQIAPDGDKMPRVTGNKSVILDLSSGISVFTRHIVSIAVHCVIIALVIAIL